MKYTWKRFQKLFYWEGNQGSKILNSFSYITCCLTMINSLWSDVNDISSPRQGQADQTLIQFIYLFIYLFSNSNLYQYFILRHSSTFTFSHTLEGFDVSCEWTYSLQMFKPVNGRYPGICCMSLPWGNPLWKIRFL